MSHPAFAEANAPYDEARFVLYGIPFDGTSSFRAGSRWAPDAMRKVSYNFEAYVHDFGVDLERVPIHDMGNCETSVGVGDTLAETCALTKGIVNAGKVPIMMGGEHSLTYACVEAFRGKVGVVVLDAHLDLRKEYRGAKHNHACVSRHIIEELTDRYVALGVRSGTQEEWAFVRDHPELKFYTADDICRRGIDAVLKEVDAYFSGCDRIYLSLDMDAVDPAYAPGLGTPEPFGITPRDVRAVVGGLAPKAAGFDIVEIAPEYDCGEITAVLGAKLIRYFIAAKWKSMNKG